MKQDLFKQLEKMKENNAPLTDYFDKLIEIINTLKDNHRIIILYKIISIIRDLDYEEGKRAEREIFKNRQN